MLHKTMLYVQSCNTKKIIGSSLLLLMFHTNVICNDRQQYNVSHLSSSSSLFSYCFVYVSRRRRCYVRVSAVSVELTLVQRLTKHLLLTSRVDIFSSLALFSTPSHHINVCLHAVQWILCT